MDKSTGYASIYVGNDLWRKSILKGHRLVWNDISFIVHRSSQVESYLKDWMVTEPSTGLSLGSKAHGRTKKECIDNTLTFLDSMSVDKVKAVIIEELHKNRVFEEVLNYV